MKGFVESKDICHATVGYCVCPRSQKHTQTSSTAASEHYERQEIAFQLLNCSPLCVSGV